MDSEEPGRVFVGWGCVRDEPWTAEYCSSFDAESWQFLMDSEEPGRVIVGWSWVRDEPRTAIKQNAYVALHLLYQLILNNEGNSCKLSH
jgi:hypothetical protein